MTSAWLLLVAGALRFAFLLGVLWLFLEHDVGWGWWLLVLFLTSQGVATIVAKDLFGRDRS